jgi:myo-inositol-1(or 4)-monophosphatase
LDAQLRHQDSETRLTTRACETLSDAVLATTSPDQFLEPLAAQFWQSVTGAAKLTRYGGDCYNYALLAMGQLDAVIETGLSHYDIQPLISIIEQAGGVITDWQGGPAHEGGSALACGDHALHAQLLDRANSASQ